VSETKGADGFNISADAWGTVRLSFQSHVSTKEPGAPGQPEVTRTKEEETTAVSVARPLAKALAFVLCRYILEQEHQAGEAIAMADILLENISTSRAVWDRFWGNLPGGPGAILEDMVLELTAAAKAQGVELKSPDEVEPNRAARRRQGKG
jgi:hypothetical protein